MEYFKIKASRLAQRHKITPQIYNGLTNHKYPFEKVNPDKTVSQYAICPSCLNPIQIIGVAKRTTVSPYGKHTGKDVTGLADWKQIKYEYCPYAIKNYSRAINDEELLPEITEDVIELYELLKTQFDRVVYLISKELEIKCSDNFWRNALRIYLANMYYCFPWLTEVNLPYLFAYFGMCHSNPYGQSVKKDSDLFYALKKNKSINLDTPNKYNPDYLLIKGNEFFRIEYRFTGYKYFANQGEILNEKIIFCVDDILTGKTFFEKEIIFNETYFINLINSKKYPKFRNQHLLDIAQNLMKPLK